jgi:outer membrane protein insertion porin family
MGATYFLSGCMTTHLLQEDEYLLGKQRIKGTQKVSKRALAQHYQQHPNSKWLGVPFLLWVYQAGYRSFDEAVIQQRIAQTKANFESKIVQAVDNQNAARRLRKKLDKRLRRREKMLKEGNLLMRCGEPPVIYSPQQRATTEQSLLAHLHAKGYFDAQVSSVAKLHNRKTTITYQIRENKPYLLGELRLNTSDQAIEKLLQEYQQQSLLKEGDDYDQEVLRKERERIYELLSNHGYFGFDRQCIRFDIDTTGADNLVVVETVIDIPADRQAHLVFYIDQVVWDVGAAHLEKGAQDDICYGDITFKNLGRQFRPSLLANKLSLHLNQPYRKQDLLETQQRLSRLDIFKHIHVTYDISDSNKLVPRIHTIPTERFQLSNELGLQVGPWSPRPFYKLSLKGKNLFRRLENVKLESHVNVERVAATSVERDFASSQTHAVALSLSWPQLLLPLSATTHARLERRCPMTELSFNYKHTWHPDYKQDTLTSFLRYDWKDHGRGVYEFTPLGIELTNTKDKSDEFARYLDDLRAKEHSLHRTFNTSWVDLLSLKSSFHRRPIPGTYLSYSLLELFFESGGALQNFINLRELMPRLEYYQYIKFNIAYSQCIPLCVGTTFAYRVQAGAANPYGANNILPYDRYYFLGGANDMRAWYPRSLGPGAYSPPKRTKEKYHAPGQPGSLLLQSSVELRQQLVGLLEGALFVDVGNIWTLHEDDLEGGKFSFHNFYKEIAVGTGVGLRLNFKVLALRLDVGFKLYDPARPLGKRFVGHQLLRQPIFNIGIDYPF